jgi:RNA polymerase sigma-70 factor (ECF subfamily)
MTSTVIEQQQAEDIAIQTAAHEEQMLVAALRAGDEAAFVTLVERYHLPLMRLARLYVPDQTAAEEVVQEAWLGVLQGLGRFEGRCSLKTWIFRIVTNIAKTRGQRERRRIAFSLLDSADEGSDEPVVDPDRFGRDGHWVLAPQSWDELPEERLLARETRERIRAAIAVLPPRQQTVITLRDVEGWTAEEVCELLEIAPTHQRVLLHRARSAVRQSLEQYLSEGSGADTGQS